MTVKWGTTLGRVPGEKSGQSGGRLDWSKEKGHFMSKLNQCVRIKKFRLALQIKGSSKLM